MAGKQKEDSLIIKDKLKAVLVPEDEQPYPIPKNWVWTKLAVIADINMGQSPSGVHTNTDSNGLLLVGGPADMGDVYPTTERFTSKPTKVCEPGDIILSVRATLGKLNIADKEYCLGRGVAGIRGIVVNQHFIKRYLETCTQALVERGTGTTFLQVSKQDIATLAVPLPPLKEQQRIAERLESIFGKIKEAKTLLDGIPEILQDFRQSVLAAACSGQLTKDWRHNNHNAESASKLLLHILTERRKKWEKAELAKLIAKSIVPKDDKWKKKYKDPGPVKKEETYEIPSTWVWCNLDQVSWSVKDGPHYSPEYVETGIPFISGGNVRPDGIDFSSAKHISPELYEQLSERCIPEYGDLLYTKGGTTGIARVNTETRDFSVWVHVAVLKLVDSIDRFYLQHTLNSPYCYAQSQKNTHGVGNQDLGLTRMIWITIPLPPLEEQQEIARRVESLFRKADDFEARYKEAMELIESLPEGILAKAFRGELMPQDPNDEPALKLLEHILKERESVVQKEQKEINIKAITSISTGKKQKELNRTSLIDFILIKFAFRPFSIIELQSKSGMDKDYLRNQLFELLSETKKTEKVRLIMKYSKREYVFQLKDTTK